MQAGEIHISLQDISLTASLEIPQQPKGLVIAAAGRNCPGLKVQHEHLSRQLRKHHIASLFTYLLETPEEQEYDNPFDIPLMGERLLKITNWALRQPGLHSLPTGYFAANVAAASALEASIAAGSRIKAIVCCCGRPDLARYELALVKPATLLIAASEDVYITELNKQAYDLLNDKKKMVVLEGTAHSFEETAKAHKVAELAAEWFDYHLNGATVNPSPMAKEGAI